MRSFGLPRLRHQLPVYSPLGLGALLHAAGEAMLGSDARAPLSEHLRREFGAGDVVLCGSGTQALQLAIEVALGAAGEAGGVALPAFGCYDLAAGAVGAGARVSLYDLDPETLSPDLESVERVLSEGARVIVAAPLYGIPIDWDALETLTTSHGAVLVEDAAQGHGASMRGRPLGSLGRLSVLSFGRGKGWTGGRGGALLMRGREEGPTLPEQGRLAETVSLAGILAQWALGRPALYAIPRAVPGLALGDTRYHPPAAPVRCTRVGAALLRGSREAADAEARGRRARAREMIAELRGAAGVRLIRPVPGGEAGYLRLPVRISGGLAAIPRAADAVRLGAATSYPNTLGELPQLRERLSGAQRRWPGAEQLVRTLVTLPTHSRVSPSERRTLVRILSWAAPASVLVDRRPGSGSTTENKSANR